MAVLEAKVSMDHYGIDPWQMANVVLVEAVHTKKLGPWSVHAPSHMKVTKW